MSTLERVQTVIAAEHGRGWQPDEVTEDMHLESALGFDSLDRVEMVMHLEEEFGIEIPDADTVAWISVRDVVRYLDNRLGNPPA